MWEWLANLFRSDNAPIKLGQRRKNADTMPIVTESPYHKDCDDEGASDNGSGADGGGD
jgi:hypothetical protein